MTAAIGAAVLYAALTRHRLNIVEGWLLLVAILGVALIRIYSVRIEVGDDRISRVDGFWSTQTIRFDQIDRSVPRAIAERNHPLWLDIFPKAENPGSDVLRLPLKSCSQADVRWLMSLEPLRIQS